MPREDSWKMVCEDIAPIAPIADNLPLCITVAIRAYTPTDIIDLLALTTDVAAAAGMEPAYRRPTKLCNRSQHRLRGRQGKVAHHSLLALHQRSRRRSNRW